MLLLYLFHGRRREPPATSTEELLYPSMARSIGVAVVAMCLLRAVWATATRTHSCSCKTTLARACWFRSSIYTSETTRTLSYNTTTCRVLG